jgi:hypothetical protein
MRQKSSELIKSMPHKMKNQGMRDVRITTAGGEAVTVKAAYYTKKRNRGERKNGVPKRKKEGIGTQRNGESQN